MTMKKTDIGIVLSQIETISICVSFLMDDCRRAMEGKGIPPHQFYDRAVEISERLRGVRNVIGSTDQSADDMISHWHDKFVGASHLIDSLKKDKYILSRELELVVSKSRECYARASGATWLAKLFLASYEIQKNVGLKIVDIPNVAIRRRDEFGDKYYPPRIIKNSKIVMDILVNQVARGIPAYQIGEALGISDVAARSYIRKYASPTLRKKIKRSYQISAKWTMKIEDYCINRHSRRSED